MFKVTYTATEHMAHMLAHHEVPNGLALRIDWQNDGFDIEPDKIRPGDETFDHNGTVVMVVCERALEMLSDSTLDVATNDDDGPHLILD